ncbi:S8 family peptidase [Mycobacterium sp.]|uniref:S8 family peptidase n=1 Tax=Mycobacterium sp. TaxID=1785 RepID=UPI002D9EB9E7|nr:S8 family serine peptidase [Mycobacterium sp.]
MTTSIPGRALYTGRQVVVLAPKSGRSNPARALASIAGLSNVAHTKDFESQALSMSDSDEAEATVFDELGVAVVSSDPDQRSALVAAAAEGDVVLSVEPELIHHALTVTDYARGYHDGVSDLYGRLNGDNGGSSTAVAAAPADNDQFTWGLQATRVSTSSRTGRGVRLAVLDTGFDVDHPDFAGRSVTTQSFILGETVRDAHGHGTHCIGTSCGSASANRRYGVATEAEIFAGKVLSDSGSGSDTGILAGINWALANDCKIISMSLGADLDQLSRAYETVGQRALDRGTLIVAAAGNNAQRPGDPGFVGVPANSPSIMAIAALDPANKPARFSARSSSRTGDGGRIDLAAPGVKVFSSWPMEQRYHSISGTSMATPHVSGIAAMWLEATGMTGRELWALLVQNATPLDVPSVDVGAGLAQAPQ